MRNVEEAEKDGGLVSLTVISKEGNEKIHSHNSGKGIRGSHSWDGREREFPLTPGLRHVRSLREEK